MTRTKEEQDAYLEGYDAYQKGAEYDHNPYDGELAWEWEEGWDDAQYGRDADG